MEFIRFDKRIFDHLLSKTKCETGDDIDWIGFGSKTANHSIGFYACIQDDYHLVVDEFHLKVNGEWHEAKPTDEQLEEMKAIIVARKNEMEQEEERERIFQVIVEQEQLEEERYFTYDRFM